MNSWFTVDAIRDVVIMFPVFLFSLVFHECAHAWMGLRRGDDLAYHMGRLTLNPIPHIDPVGTLILPIFLMLSPGGMMFGWAKPVPVNPKVSTKDMMIIAAAGPLSNMLLVPVFLAATFALSRTVGPESSEVLKALLNMAWMGVVWNVILAGFNLIPIPPLDGSKILYYFLPRQGRELMRMAGQYSFILFVLLIFTGLGKPFFGLIWGVINLLGALIGL